MKIKRWAAVCLAAGCVLWSGTETGASRHLAEQRAAQERESRVMQEEEDRQRAWELAQEAADTEKARGETKAPADKTAEETPREAPADTGKTEAVGQSSAKAEEVAAAEAGADSTKGEKTAKREKKGARDEGVDDANGSLRSYLQRLREKADEILHPAEPNLRIRGTRPMREWAAERSDSGGTLIFSDSPEYVKQAGILYTDELDGEARVLFYHLNQIKRPAKIALLMENTGERDAVIQLTRRGVSRPGEDYLAVGKATQAAYFSDGQKKADDRHRREKAPDARTGGADHAARAAHLRDCRFQRQRSGAPFRPYLPGGERRDSLQPYCADPAEGRTASARHVSRDEPDHSCSGQL